MVSITKDKETKYISYHITQYANCNEYSLAMMKHEYPFKTYYEKRWHKSEIPAKYIEDFEELEKSL